MYVKIKQYSSFGEPRWKKHTKNSKGITQMQPGQAVASGGKAASFMKLHVDTKCDKKTLLQSTTLVT